MLSVRQYEAVFLQGNPPAYLRPHILVGMIQNALMVALYSRPIYIGGDLLPVQASLSIDFLGARDLIHVYIDKLLLCNLLQY